MSRYCVCPQLFYKGLTDFLNNRTNSRNTQSHHFGNCVVVITSSQSIKQAVGRNYFALWQPPGEYIFCCSMYSTIDAQLPQKVPKQKTCQTLRKWVISDYPLLNCITARKCEILYSITIKMIYITRKLRKTRI